LQNFSVNTNKYIKVKIMTQSQNQSFEVSNGLKVVEVNPDCPEVNSGLSHCVGTDLEKL